MILAVVSWLVTTPARFCSLTPARGRFDWAGWEWTGREAQIHFFQVRRHDAQSHCQASLVRQSKWALFSKFDTIVAIDSSNFNAHLSIRVKRYARTFSLSEDGSLNYAFDMETETTAFQNHLQATLKLAEPQMWEPKTGSGCAIGLSSPVSRKRKGMSFTMRAHLGL